MNYHGLERVRLGMREIEALPIRAAAAARVARKTELDHENIRHTLPDDLGD
jgi:hypothetical protein